MTDQIKSKQDIILSGTHKDNEETKGKTDSVSSNLEKKQLGLSKLPLRAVANKR